MLGVRIVKEQNVGQDMRYYELLDQRVVTSGMAIAAMIVYMKPGIRPLSSEERRRVELIMRLTLNFVCRNRVQRSIEDLAFYDYDGYRNTRSLQNHFMQVERTGRFVGLAVVRYNLRHFTVVNQELGREKAMPCCAIITKP